MVVEQAKTNISLFDCQLSAGGHLSVGDCWVKEGLSWALELWVIWQSDGKSFREPLRLAAQMRVLPITQPQILVCCLTCKRSRGNTSSVGEVRALYGA
jgi:hypothetical protein